MIKSRRSVTRAFEETMNLPGPVSKVPVEVRLRLANKLAGAARRLHNAEKRLHTSGMPKERIKRVMTQPQFESTFLGLEKGNPVTRITSPFISKGYERARTRRQKEELKVVKKRFQAK